MMTDESIIVDSQTEIPPPASKKRKIRKGTQSCWECKRRKTRCTFASQAESVCDGCRSRGLRCVSQLFHYDQVDTTQATTNTHDEGDSAQASSKHLSQLADADPMVNGGGAHSKTRARTRRNTTSTNRRVVSQGGPRRVTRPDTSALGIQIDSSPMGQTTNSKHNERCNALRAAWPSKHDLDIITSIPVGTSVLFHGTVCMPYSRVLNQELPSPQEMLQLPPPESHPVLVARKLLLLGSFLQGVPAGAVASLGNLTENYRRIMSNAVETTIRLVTSDDDLIESLEGIECIMIESMYQNNSGNLRRAWLTNRRAMMVAQLVGVDRDQGNSLLPAVLDVKSRERIDPAYMWFRLVTSDRYLSLMLGLPQCMVESPFASPRALDSCVGLERMERLEVMVGGLLLQRKSEDVHDTEATNRMDELLLDAAASMPAHWWLTPSVSVIADCDTNALGETIRTMHQLVHYHLLTRLHLPYMLRSSAQSRYDYSKITAASASRELLLRFVDFHSSSMVAAYCRGVDFLAFVASTTLCLAHIDSRRQHMQGIDGRNTCVFRTLAHQRLVDRGLMERTLQLMEQRSHSDHNDAIAREVACIIHRLLVVEAAAAQNNHYTYNATLSSTNTEQQCVDGSDRNDGSGVGTEILRVQIPHFGTIKIERGQAVQYHIDLAHKAHHHNHRHGGSDETRIVDQNAWPVHLASGNLSTSTLPRPDADNADLEGRETPQIFGLSDWENAAPPSTSIMCRRPSTTGNANGDASDINTTSFNAHAQARPARDDRAGSVVVVAVPADLAAEPRPHSRSSPPQAAIITSSAPPPPLSSFETGYHHERDHRHYDGDEWTLQGVDAALFDSLLFNFDFDDDDNNSSSAWNLPLQTNMTGP